MYLDRLRWLIAVLVAIPVIISLIVLLRLIGAISSIPVTIGKRIDIESFARRIVERSVDMEITYQFRDDVLYIMEEQFYRSDIDSEKLDRWSLLRQIDNHRDEAIENLKTGETILSIGGAILSVTIGIWTDIRFVGVGLTLVVILFSLLVVLRVVVTDLLSYRSTEVRNDSLELLLLKQSWNENQINYGSSVVWASLLITASSSEVGYRSGMQLVQWFGDASNPIDNKRYLDETSSE